MTTLIYGGRRYEVTSEEAESIREEIVRILNLEKHMFITVIYKKLASQWTTKILVGPGIPIAFES